MRRPSPDVQPSFLESEKPSAGSSRFPTDEEAHREYLDFDNEKTDLTDDEIRLARQEAGNNYKKFLEVQSRMKRNKNKRAA